MSFELATSAQSQFQEIIDQFTDVSARANGVTKDLQTHELNLRPEAHRWSIAECLVHLTLCSSAYLELINLACQKAREERLFGDGPFKMDWTGKLIRLASEPPSRVRLSSTAAFQPTLVEPLEQVVPRFIDLQSALIISVESAHGLDLNRIKINSPSSARVSFNLFSCYHILAAHERRHLNQAEETRRDIES